jgi:hypothetical protein
MFGSFCPYSSINKFPVWMLGIVWNSTAEIIILDIDLRFV